MKADVPRSGLSKYEKLVKTFHYRLLRLMEETKEALDRSFPLQQLGASVGQIEHEVLEEATYRLTVSLGARGADVTLTVLDAIERDGIEDRVAFGIEIEAEGRTLGGIVPLNYSEELWIDVEDEEACKMRLRILEEYFNPHHAADVIARYLKGD